MVLAPLAFSHPAAAAPGEDVPSQVTRRLLERLDERRMQDVVLWVLDRVERDPSIASDLKAEVPFRRGLALSALGRSETDPAKRAARFDAAQAEFDRVVDTPPTDDALAEMLTQKANLLIERGRSSLAQGRRPGADIAAARNAANSFFAGAIASLEGTTKPQQPLPTKITTAEDAVLGLLRAVQEKTAQSDQEPTGREGGRRSARRSSDAARELEQAKEEERRLQARLIQIRLMVAAAWYEASTAHEEGSPEWSRRLTGSTERFRDIADKYPKFGAGVFARLYQGRNEALLGKHEAAVATLAPLTVLEGGSPTAESIRRRALAITFDSWLALERFDGFGPELRKLVLTSLPPARLDADWLTLKYQAARLLAGQAGTLPPAQRAKRKTLEQDAQRLANEVARANREWAGEARALVAGLGGTVRDDPRLAPTFDAALDDAQAALAAMQQARAESRHEDAATERDRAITLIRQALASPRASEADPAQVNRARALLTHLLYEAGRFLDAAALGEFLVDHYPRGQGSRQASRIALASWQQIQRSAPAAWRDGARAGLADLATRIMRTWPGDAEAGDAAIVAVAAAAAARDPQRIMAVVGAAPATSPRRSELLQTAGTHLWREVLARRAMRDADLAALEPWWEQARTLLEEGLASIEDAAPSRTSAWAVLARGRMAMEDADFRLAARWLEDPRHGPRAVLEGSVPGELEGDAAFAEEAWSTELRFQVERGDIDRARDAMGRLEALAGSGPAAASRLAAIYLTIGRKLQSEIDVLTRTAASGGGSRERAERLVRGFDAFLDGVARLDPKVSTQLWVASTYLTLATGGDAGGPVNPAQATQYRDRARGIFEGLLARLTDPADAAVKELVEFEPAIRLKLIDLLASQGRFEDAQREMDWILADARRQNMPELQVQAAELLMAAGKHLASENVGEAERTLREAIVGRTTGASVVWGWAGLGKRLSRAAFAGEDPRALRARGQFFESRLRLAGCLLERARLPGTPPERVRELLAKAEDSIRVTRELHPDLGGEPMRTRFERVLKDIQRAASREPRGFDAFDRRPAGSSSD
jgi:hypothetical protein